MTRAYDPQHRARPRTQAWITPPLSPDQRAALYIWSALWLAIVVNVVVWGFGL